MTYYWESTHDLASTRGSRPQDALGYLHHSPYIIWSAPRDPETTKGQRHICNLPDAGATCSHVVVSCPLLYIYRWQEGRWWRQVGPFLYILHPLLTSIYSDLQSLKIYLNDRPRSIRTAEITSIVEILIRGSNWCGTHSTCLSVHGVWQFIDYECGNCKYSLNQEKTFTISWAIQFLDWDLPAILLSF